MRERFIVFMDVDGEISEPEKKNAEYKIGDIIARYSYDNQYKCVEIKTEGGQTTYLFKQGKRIYTFDW